MTRTCCLIQTQFIKVTLILKPVSHWLNHTCMYAIRIVLYLTIFHWALVWDWVLFGSDNKIDFERGLGMCVSRALESGVEVRFWRARDLFGSEWVAHNNADAITVLDVDLLNLARWSQKWTTGLSGTKSKTLKETNVLRCCCCCCCCNYINTQ